MVVCQEYGAETVETILQELAILRPEADEARLLELLHGVASMQGTKLGDLAKDPWGDRLLEALVQAECRELDRAEQGGLELANPSQREEPDEAPLWHEPPSTLEEQLASREARRRNEARRRGSVGQGNLLRRDLEPNNEDSDDGDNSNDDESTEPPGSPKRWDIAGWSPGLSPGLNDLAQPLAPERESSL